MLDHNPLAASVKGERYEASVPDTLDLADRMGLAVNAMTNVWFPSERFALGFNVEFSRRPPVLSINHLTDAYLNIPAKFIEALVVCRLGLWEPAEYRGGPGRARRAAQLHRRRRLDLLPDGHPRRSSPSSARSPRCGGRAGCCLPCRCSPRSTTTPGGPRPQSGR